MRCIGTLGGGNHFIEMDQSRDGSFWLIIHSGSRNLGAGVANFYQKLRSTPAPKEPRTNWPICRARSWQIICTI